MFSLRHYHAPHKLPDGWNERSMRLYTYDFTSGVAGRHSKTTGKKCNSSIRSRWLTTHLVENVFGSRQKNTLFLYGVQCSNLTFQLTLLHFNFSQGCRPKQKREPRKSCCIFAGSKTVFNDILSNFRPNIGVWPTIITD